MGLWLYVRGHGLPSIRSEPEASATAQPQGLAGPTGSPRLGTRRRIGFGDAAVADASGSDDRDRPDRLSGICSGSHPGWEIPAVGQVSNLLLRVPSERRPPEPP